MVPLLSGMSFVPDSVVMADLGNGGALLDTTRPVAAFVNPTALSWLRGQRPADADDVVYQECWERWRAAGLIHPDGERAVASSTLDEVKARADQVAVPHPTLVLAMAAECGFCDQLSADLAANAAATARLNASVLLANGEDHDVLGLSLAPHVREQLAGVGRLASRLGTPSGVLLVAGEPSRTVVGYPEVSAELVRLSGGDAQATVIEAPTTCSVQVAGEKADSLVRARTGSGRVVAIAVRDANTLNTVRSATGAGLQDIYAPVTLTVDRPGSLYLLYRGGELLARARTSGELQHALVDVLAGYSSPKPGEIPLLCAAAVHQTGHAVLLPRNWMTDLVTHSTRLERAGWRVCTRPYATVRPSRRTSPLLTSSSASPQSDIPISSIMAQLPQTAGALTRSQLLAQVINWIHRPTRPHEVHSLAAALGPLPVHAGTWPQARDHLLAAS